MTVDIITALTKQKSNITSIRERAKNQHMQTTSIFKKPIKIWRHSLLTFTKLYSAKVYFLCNCYEKIMGVLEYISLRGDTGLPWWRSGWESACRCRRHGFEPWSGKIPHAAEQLGRWATTTEPAHLEPVLCNKRGHDSERPAHCDEEWPPLATTGESPRTETKTQHSQK